MSDKNECCERCHGEYTPKYGENAYRCLDAACPCHQPPPSSLKEAEAALQRGETLTHDHLATSTDTGWKEELERRALYCCAGCMRDDENRAELIAFIAALLASERTVLLTDLAAEVEGKHKPWCCPEIETHDDYCCKETAGFNAAINDAVAIIKKRLSP